MLNADGDEQRMLRALLSRRRSKVLFRGRGELTLFEVRLRSSAMLMPKQDVVFSVLTDHEFMIWEISRFALKMWGCSRLRSVSSFAIWSSSGSNALNVPISDPSRNEAISFTKCER